MNRRFYLSVSVAALLLVGSVAPWTVSSRVTDSDADAVVRSADADDAEESSRPKGNKFARAFTAPFRAFGKLFGGGKKKTIEEAKQPAPAAEQSEVAVKELAAAAATAATTAVPSRLAEKLRKEEKKRLEREKKQAALQAAAAERAEAAGAGQSESVRIMRPGQGEPTPELAKAAPRWIPNIEGVAPDPLSQGRALLQHGYLREAVAELSVAATVGPDLIEANNLLGLAFDRLGERARASEAYERALTVAPTNPQVLNNLGYSLHLAGRNAEALKRLKQAEKLAPGAPYVLQNIARVQARMGKFDDAYKSFARAFGEYDGRLKTAELLEQSGRLDEAIKHYNAALRIQPDSAALIERLADLYDRTGRQRDAEAARRARGKQPNEQKTATGGGGGG